MANLSRKCIFLNTLGRKWRRMEDERDVVHIMNEGYKHVDC